MPAEVLWRPSPLQIEQSQLTRFREFVNERYPCSLGDYAELYQWSVNEIAEFWGAAWEFLEIISSGSYTTVVDDPAKMPGARWFDGIRLNFAENLCQRRDDHPAIVFWGENEVRRSLSYEEVYGGVRRLAQAMRDTGVVKGDRVAAFIPNLPEAIIAMLATTSIGAIWSSTSPDFGIRGVLDRLQQIEPKVLFAADGYFYKGRSHDSLERLQGILHELPTVEKVVVVSYTRKADLAGIPNAIAWDDFLPDSAPELAFEPVPFNHPLYIMFSSGTTGLPKSIVHSVGGTLIQHLKELRLHTDLTSEDHIFYFTTCGWMMWNWLVTSLAVGATVVLFDGNPFYPTPRLLWDMADEAEISVFGTSAKYLAELEAAGERPMETHHLEKLRAILSTGSPLSEESFDYVYRDIKEELLLASISGGTDILSCFALGNPTLPVQRGFLQCRGLGMKVETYDSEGNSVINEKGELVCTAAFPSMPIAFWDDPEGKRYREAYFEDFDDVWRHGDYILINDEGGVKIYGRSDATLNPAGVRIGTAEIYRALERIDEVADSVAVGQEWKGEERVVLFVKLAPGSELSDELVATIQRTIRERCSPRHVPAKILPVADIPYTLNGKKVELAVKQMIHGEEVVNQAALLNPETLAHYRNRPELKQ